MTTKWIIAIAVLLALREPANSQYAAWQHSGSMFILTTPEGANLPASALEKGFPLLVRLHKDWFDQLASQFYLDGEAGLVASGSTRANALTLKLKAPSTAKHITYLKEATWNQDALLLGQNGMAALTFCEVPLEAGN